MKYRDSKGNDHVIAEMGYHHCKGAIAKMTKEAAEHEPHPYPRQDELEALTTRCGELDEAYAQQQAAAEGMTHRDD